MVIDFISKTFIGGNITNEVQKLSENMPPTHEMGVDVDHGVRIEDT